MGRLPDIAGWGRSATLYLAVATIAGFVIGDTFYYRSLALIGVSKTLPIAGSYPVLTLIVSLLAFGGTVRALDFVGAIAVAGGVYLVGTARNLQTVHGRGTPAPRAVSVGVLFAVLAAASWSVSINVLKMSIADLHVVPANAFRMTLGALLLMTIVAARHRGFARVRKYPARSLLVVGASSVVGLAGGSLLFIMAVKHASAGRAAVLTATAPLFAVPMARVFLGERAAPRLIIGVLLCLAGITVIMVSEGRGVG
jgi:drug/metabolite transporter (DMT)-like permease